jgi:hypothetical protein
MPSTSPLEIAHAAWRDSLHSTLSIGLRKKTALRPTPAIDIPARTAILRGVASELSVQEALSCCETHALRDAIF